MVKFLYLIVFLFISFYLINPVYSEGEDSFDDEDIENLEGGDLRENFDAEELTVNENNNKGASPKLSEEPKIEQEEIVPQNTQVEAEDENFNINPSVKRIIGVEFLQKQTSSQLVIKLNEPAEFKTYFEQSGSIVVVNIINTLIPAKWRRFLDTSEFRSAVTFIKPYPVAGRTNSVKFVMKLRDKVAVDTKRDGNNIIVEVEIPEKYYGPHPKEAEVQKDEAVTQPTEESQEEKGSEETGFADEQIQEDSELGELLKEEGEVVGNEFDEEQISGVEPKTSEEDFVADEYLSMGPSEIEGFTLSELSDDHKFTGKKVSITFKDADIMNVMDFISEVSKMNLILGDNVAGKVNLKLKDVPWDQALAIILQSKMLGAVRHGNVIRVETLDKLRAEQEASIQALESAKRIEPLKTFMIPINYATAQDMQAQLNDFITPGRGKITIDNRTNTLIVQDLVSNIERIRNLIYKLDTQTPQVLIEARIIEVSKSFSRGLNMDWRAMGGQIMKTPLTYLSSVSVARGAFGGETFGNFQLGFLNLQKIGDLTLALKIGESRSEVKLLSAPRIITQDNKAAAITQKEETQVVSKTFTSSESGATITEEKKTLTATLELGVTPHITSDGGIHMNIGITNEFFKGTDGTKASRSAMTNVMVENGDTTVIGGIYSNQQTKARSGIPVLSWLPLVGWLFSSNESIMLRNELMIFVTPTITNAEKAFVGSDAALDKSKSDFNETSDASENDVSSEDMNALEEDEKIENEQQGEEGIDDKQDDFEEDQEVEPEVESEGEFEGEPEGEVEGMEDSKEQDQGNNISELEDQDSYEEQGSDEQETDENIDEGEAQEQENEKGSEEGEDKQGENEWGDESL